MHRPDVRGFTLVELMVALALGGVALLAARLLVAGAAETGARAAAEQVAADSTNLPLRIMRDLFRRIEVGTDTQATFVGGPRSLAFTSWCQTASGWLERCRVVLDTQRSDADVVVRLRTGTATPALVARAPRVRWHYLEDPANGGRWAPQWGTRLTAPLAVLLIVGGDSLLLRIGERG